MGNRLEFLDSLRGLAAVYVILCHMPVLVSPHLGIPDAIAPLQLYGWTGVQLFFVVSAFLLCHTMPTHQNTGKPLISYAISRIARIAPLFYVLILYNVLNTWLTWGVWPDPLRVITSLTFTFNLSPTYANGIVGAGWTIGVEMLFYLLFPLFYFCFRSLATRLLFACLAFVAWPLFRAFILPMIEDPALQHQFSGLTLAAHLPTFALGMVAFSVLEKLRGHSFAPAIGIASFAAGLAGLGYLFTRMVSFGVLDFIGWVSIFYTMIVIGLGLCPLSLVVNRVTTFYGRICYSVYLWHPVVIMAMEPIYHKIYARGLGIPISFTLCFAATIAVVTGVAVLSHRYIEQPGLDLGRAIKAIIMTRTVGRPASAF